MNALDQSGFTIWQINSDVRVSRWSPMALAIG